jgi:hypothetical protein
MNQQHNHTIECENLILQDANKMSQGGSPSWNCCSCNVVHRRHLNELGVILIELVPKGLQGCVGPKHKVPLLMDDYLNILHGMERAKVCGFLYQTKATGS